MLIPVPNIRSQIKYSCNTLDINVQPTIYKLNGFRMYRLPQKGGERVAGRGSIDCDKNGGIRTHMLGRTDRNLRWKLWEWLLRSRLVAYPSEFGMVVNPGFANLNQFRKPRESRWSLHEQFENGPSSSFRRFRRL